jgi:prepilin-type N-terminal cleavage/methylation domain-containing protein
MKQQHGFTLIEMAIVLVIITILIGGLAVPLSAQIQARRVAETRQVMQEAREAVLGYAMTHLATPAGKRYLPCPDTTGDGREDRNLATQACTQAYGWLPWVTLGTAAQDAWGNRLLYAVVSPFGDKATGFSSSTALASPLQICSTHTCASPDVASNVVFVLTSFGPNGWGALNVSGSNLAAPSGADELENLDADQSYISRSPTKPDAASGEFDDLTVWMSGDLLKAKVCPPGSDCNP